LLYNAIPSSDILLTLQLSPLTPSVKLFRHSTFASSIPSRAVATRAILSLNVVTNLHPLHIFSKTFPAAPAGRPLLSFFRHFRHITNLRVVPEMSPPKWDNAGNIFLKCPKILEKDTT
jgi:hypothetical protein